MGPRGNLIRLSMLLLASVLTLPATLPRTSSAGGDVQTVMVPLRDGTQLSTELWFPDAAQLPLPVLLVRSAYGKQAQGHYGSYFSQHGYIVAIQDVRGTGDSKGRFQIWEHEKQDGYDAVEWLAAQDWSSGKIGMIGGSYSGWVQLAAAVMKPPHLVTIIPRVTMGDPYFNHVYPGGMFTLTHLQAVTMLERLARRSSGHQLPRDWRSRLSPLPVIDLDRELFGKEHELWRKHLRHATCDSFWESTYVLEELETVGIPVFLQSGWFDFGGIGTKLAYQHLRRSDHRDVKLLIGPWLHSGKTPPGEDFDWGPDADVDFLPLFRRWFDAWLLGKDNGIREEPLVRVFAVGPNRWLEADSYPVPGTTQLKLYLSSETGANTVKGDGRLLRQAPAAGAAFDSYVYDPADPTPSLWYDGLGRYAATVASRSDILVYETEPFAEPVVVLGPVSARLYASSSAKDTDWVAYWRAIDDQGEVIPLGRGTLRARFRNSPRHPELLTENEI